MAFPTVTDPTFIWNRFPFDMDEMSKVPLAVFDGPAVVMATIVPDATGVIPFTQGPTRAINCSAAMTVVGHDAFGNPITLALSQGWNSVSLWGITSVSTGTAVGVW